MTLSGAAPNANDSRRAGAYAELRDPELILAMRRGEQQAFVEFIQRYRLLVWNHARDLGVDAFVLGTTGDKIGTHTLFGGAFKVKF